uniref:Uncharacterized protein n=1 Tax=Tanacetum cinerariifolium TaxID=118510 RepID=A0A6L2K4G3_TANCI|nr:hypothetical protein [Tanacetum cinerariifolium]
MPKSIHLDHHDTAHYIPMYHRTRGFTVHEREVYKSLISRLIHKGRVINSTFLDDQPNLRSTFAAIGFDCLLNIDEKICPIFVLQFYKIVPFLKFLVKEFVCTPPNSPSYPFKMGSLVKTKQKGKILELKRRYLKNIIFCYYTPYPAMKIRCINARSAQEMRNDQFPIRRITLQPYAVCIASPNSLHEIEDPNIMMEEYIQLVADKAQGPIVYNDAPASTQNVSFERTVSMYNAIKSDIDFHITFSDSEDEDYTFIYNEDSSSYKLIHVNDLRPKPVNNYVEINTESWSENIDVKPMDSVIFVSKDTIPIEFNKNIKTNHDTPGKSFAIKDFVFKIKFMVMAISIILVSSEESVGTSTRRVILFGTIPTTIPDTTLSMAPPSTHIDTTSRPIVSSTIPPSADYTPASSDYSPASDTESDPFEDPSSDHIPPLPAISPFLSSIDDSLKIDIPDTPPSPTYGTPFTETTLSTQRSPVASGSCRRRVMVLAPGQPIPYGRPYRYHLNGPVHMMTVRKRVGPLPTHRLDMRHLVDYSSTDYFALDDSLRDSSLSSSLETSSNSPSDDLSDSSSDHSLPTPSSGMRPSHHLCLLVPSIPHLSAAIIDRPSHDSSSTSPSRKRSRSPAASVPLSLPIPKALYYMDVDVKRSDGIDIDLEIQADIDECIAYADALRDKGIDARCNTLKNVCDGDIKNPSFLGFSLVLYTISSVPVIFWLYIGRLNVVVMRYGACIDRAAVMLLVVVGLYVSIQRCSQFDDYIGSCLGGVTMVVMDDGSGGCVASGDGYVGVDVVDRVDQSGVGRIGLVVGSQEFGRKRWPENKVQQMGGARGRDYAIGGGILHTVVSSRMNQIH